MARCYRPAGSGCVKQYAGRFRAYQPGKHGKYIGSAGTRAEAEAILAAWLAKHRKRTPNG